MPIYRLVAATNQIQQVGYGGTGAFTTTSGSAEHTGFFQPTMPLVATAPPAAMPQWWGEVDDTPAVPGTDGNSDLHALAELQSQAAKGANASVSFIRRASGSVSASSQKEGSGQIFGRLYSLSTETRATSSFASFRSTGRMTGIGSKSVSGLGSIRSYGRPLAVSSKGGVSFAVLMAKSHGRVIGQRGAFTTSAMRGKVIGVTFSSANIVSVPVHLYTNRLDLRIGYDLS